MYLEKPFHEYENGSNLLIIMQQIAKEIVKGLEKSKEYGELIIRNGVIRAPSTGAILIGDMVPECPYCKISLNWDKWKQMNSMEE